jgi:hypothetical protein
MQPRADLEVFKVFCHTFVACVIGKVSFKERMTDELPSSYITVSSEAYTIAYLENCYDTWLAEAEDTADKKVRSSYPRPLWTKDPQTAKIYKGWSADGYARYNALVKSLKIQRRCKETGEDLETDFREDARKIFEKTKTVKVKGTSESYVVVVYEDDTDSDEAEEKVHDEDDDEDDDDLED